MVGSPGAFTKTTPPISPACQGCHDDQATASHALANTTTLGESCAPCDSAARSSPWILSRNHGGKALALGSRNQTIGQR
jgi:hypothetical protein